jgi:hypothetical protein
VTGGHAFARISLIVSIPSSSSDLDPQLMFRWLLKREIARLFAALSCSHGLPACDVKSAVRGQVSDFLKE